MVERRKLPWGLLLSLFVLLMVTAYYLSGLAKLEGVTLENWQNQFVYILLHPLQNWWNDLTLTCLGIALIVWIGIVTYLMDYYRNRQMGVEYGSEQWADLKQIQRNLGNKDQTKNTLLSKNVAVDNGKLSNMNLLILGGSGSYKSTSIVIPNLLLASMTNVGYQRGIAAKNRKLFKREAYRSKGVKPHQSGRVRQMESVCVHSG